MAAFKSIPIDMDDLRARATKAAQSWAPGCTVDDITFLPGGTVSEVFTAQVHGGPAGQERVVLKVAPAGLPAIRNRDVIRQGQCIDALSKVPGVAVPSVLFSDEGGPVEYPPFFATEMLAGACVEPLLVAERNPVPVDLVVTRYEAAMDMLIALQSVSPAELGFADEPVVTPTGEVERWTRTLETVPDDLRIGYEACAKALLETVPEGLPPVIVHGDYRLGNMLIDGTTINGIIDWELWTPSDPRIDLTWLLFFTDEAKHPSAHHGISAGTPSQAELLARYEEGVGRSTPDLTWFDALTRYKEAAAIALIAKHMRRRDPAGAEGMDAQTTELIATAHKLIA